MEPDLLMTTFPVLAEFQRASALLKTIGAGSERIEPTPALVMSREERAALEIFKRLPGTNCGRCGMPTCLALAMHVWTGEAPVRLCLPVFEEDGKFSHLREALLEICAGMGITSVDHRQKEDK